MRQVFFIFAAVLTLGGCASTSMVTPYQQIKLLNFRGGFKEKKVAENRFQVEFDGNGFVTGQMAKDFAIMRGAELCRAAGYEYLKFISGKLITYRDIYGNRSPSAKAEVQCTYDATGNLGSVDQIIAKTQASYPNAFPKEPDQVDATK